jgi:hypothetical protein
MKELIFNDCAHVVPSELIVVSSSVQAVLLKMETSPPVAHPVREKEPPPRVPPLKGTAGAMQPVLVVERLDPTMERDGHCGFAALHALPP